MKLQANVTIVAGKKTYAPGETFDINEDEGQRLLDRKLAAPVEDQPLQNSGKIKPDPEVSSDDE